jgi:hypothetical protein
MSARVSVRQANRVERLGKMMPKYDCTVSSGKVLQQPLWAANIRASLFQQSLTKSFDCMEDAMDEALGSIDPSYECEAMVTSLDPIPVHPVRMQVVDKIHLGSTWDHSNPNTDALKWVLAMLNIEDREPPLVDTSSAGYDYASHGTSRSIQSLDYAPVNEALLKPEKWDERFQELLQFREQYGHCLVPHNWEHNKEMAQWVKRQRYQFKLRCQGQRNMLTDERLRALEEIGFIWSSHYANWDEKFQELKEFSLKHGHCNIPSRYSQNRPLSVWVRSQRRQYKLHGRGQGGKPMSHMTEERLHKLVSLGFEFNPRKRNA